MAAMAVTSTAKGIAPKFLLLGTAAGQVMPPAQHADKVVLECGVAWPLQPEASAHTLQECYPETIKPSAAISYLAASAQACSARFGSSLQIYMMDKRLVDPRRPRTDKPTETERQEGLMRYSPQLQQIASLFASYNRQIPQLRGAEPCGGMRRRRMQSS